MNILYCRVGWMEAYKGNSDERPIGGGSYNKNGELYTSLHQLQYVVAKKATSFRKSSFNNV